MQTYANLDGYNNHVANFHRYKCPNCLIDCCNLEKYNNHISICQAWNPFNPQKRVQIPPVAGTVVKRKERLGEGLGGCGGGGCSTGVSGRETAVGHAQRASPAEAAASQEGRQPRVNHQEGLCFP